MVIGRHVADDQGGCRVVRESEHRGVRDGGPSRDEGLRAKGAPLGVGKRALNVEGESGNGTQDEIKIMQMNGEDIRLHCEHQSQ